jgi:hypothetical protein
VRARPSLNCPWLFLGLPHVLLPQSKTKLADNFTSQFTVLNLNWVSNFTRNLSMQFKYLAVDEDNEPIRKFYSKQMAEWFIENKPELSLVKLTFKSDKELLIESLAEFTKRFGEPPF